MGCWGVHVWFSVFGFGRIDRDRSQHRGSDPERLGSRCALSAAAYSRGDTAASIQRCVVAGVEAAVVPYRGDDGQGR